MSTDLLEALAPTTAAPAISTAPDAAGCAHCAKPFTPRKGSGGSTQRFCSTDCRKQYHREHGSEGANEAPASSLLPPASTPAPQRPLASAGPDRFDWNTDDSVVVPSQYGIAVYGNRYGDVVIKPEGQYHDDEDQHIFVRPENLPLLIAKLQRIAKGEDG